MSDVVPESGPSSAEDRVGELLAGRYRVLRRLGAGPRALGDVMARALHPEPAERWPSAVAFAQAAERAISNGS